MNPWTTYNPRKWLIHKVRPGCWWVTPPYLIGHKINRPHPERRGATFTTGSKAIAEYIYGLEE